MMDKHPFCLSDMYKIAKQNPELLRNGFVFGFEPVVIEWNVILLKTDK